MWDANLCIQGITVCNHNVVLQQIGQCLYSDMACQALGVALVARHIDISGMLCSLTPHLSHLNWSMTNTSAHILLTCIFQSSDVLCGSSWAFLFADLWDDYFSSCVDDVFHHGQFCSAVPVLYDVRWTIFFHVGPSISDGFALSYLSFIPSHQLHQLTQGAHHIQCVAYTQTGFWNNAISFSNDCLPWHKLMKSFIAYVTLRNSFSMYVQVHLNK